MDENQLRQTLNGWGVNPPDVLRASLYLTQLQATRTFLLTTLGTTLGPFYARVGTALQDPRLLDNFCGIIDRFVAPAVGRDLDTAYRGQYTTYQDYFNKFIFQANGGNFAQNVQAFYTRYPSTDRVVLALTANFQQNIQTACQRLQQNWSDLNKTFCVTGSQITALIRIEATGSDFHKGGQQVLILTFSLFIVITDNMGDVHPLTDTLKIVYKPSDLEADCRIAGDSAAVNTIHAGFQAASLFEIINTLVAAEKKNNPSLEPLPTYKILPYNWGSSLHATGGVLPIRTSYGYIEFLEHKHAPGKNIWNYYPFGQSDFKIFPKQNAVAIAKAFYQQLGELLAVASSFSIVDMHMENVIVNRYQARLIDLEICLTRAIETVDNTSFFGRVGGITAEVLDGVEYDWGVVGPDGDKAIEKQFKEPPPVKQNRLWTMEPDQVVNPGAEAPARALSNGFLDGMMLIQGGVNATPNVFTAWFGRLTNVVVRFLPAPTADFRKVMNDIYQQFMNVQDYSLGRIRTLVTESYTSYQGHPTPGPNFVAIQDTYTGAAFLNGDIPTFYRRIDSLDIMDDSGNPVVIPATVTINNVPPPGTRQVPVRVPLGRDTFFATPQTATNVRQDQVDFLSDGAQFGARYNLLHGTLLDELGLAAVPPIGTVIH